MLAGPALPRNTFVLQGDLAGLVEGPLMGGKLQDLEFLVFFPGIAAGSLLQALQPALVIFEEVALPISDNQVLEWNRFLLESPVIGLPRPWHTRQELHFRGVHLGVPHKLWSPVLISNLIHCFLTPSHMLYHLILTILLL
jgi:hypothetical protein